MAKQRLQRHDTVAQDIFSGAKDSVKTHLSRLFASRNYELEFLSDIEMDAASTIAEYTASHPAIFAPDDGSPIIHDALSGTVLINYSGQATRDGLDLVSLLALARRADLLYVLNATDQRSFGVAIARSLFDSDDEPSRLHESVAVNRIAKKLQPPSLGTMLDVPQAMQYVSILESAFAYGDLGKLQHYSNDHREVASLLGTHYDEHLFL
jgi:hypothetical protein